MKYCQGPKCHTYDTTDRKRGTKGNKRNQTRSITHGFGNDNFCTLQCQSDWWVTHGNQAVDYFGRIHQPIIMAEENAWRRCFNPNRHDSNWNLIEGVPTYIEENMFTGEQRPCAQT